MIIFGTRGKYLKQQSDAFDCTNCGSLNTVRMSFIQRYFHIFWIPIFPTSKTGISQCSNCKQALYLNEMPQALKMTYNESKKTAKTPLKYFIGLLLIALFFAFAILGIVAVTIAEGRYAKNSMVGDVYAVELPNKLYTYYKIEEIRGDTVSFSVHEYTARTLAAMQKVRRQYEDTYGTERIKFAKKDINGRIGTARISSIDRD
ncbi:zinc-ribbon domain-containing protein [Pedobacter petrophilus]|uniref:Zinc-ribbon domain-containing protein n=1 Tax=Pedobacter petrophilus TaxID=1908241 RepID=A0A7K0G0P0_9SPHI|nr:zinc-ribbon domain-containing protein [Pedobacter petrophilus]MRX76556.1 zinc-ribbon domain-containing protein [Pedobacter petrophilus]